MPPSLIARASNTDSDDNNHLSGIYIGGIAFACVFAVVAVAWLTIRQIRKRNQKKCGNMRNSAFLNVKGVVSEKEVNPEDPNAFNRNNIGNVVMPTTAEQILEYHRANGTLTHAFKISVSKSIDSTSTGASTIPTAAPATSSPSPSSNSRRPGTGPRQPSRLNPDAPSRSSFNPTFTLNHGGGHSSQSSVAISDYASARPMSTISWIPPSPGGADSQRASIIGSWRHSRASSHGSGFSTGGLGERTVRQTYTPVLPDELLLSIGERVNVVQTLDDGWCVVGRAGGVIRAEVFGQKAEDGVEMGVVPAWVFIKPTKGLRAERPMRTTSLGLTVELPAPGFAGREQVMSWSNF
ncbi:hypothetical protein PENSPDRAFT_694506 [Peniophora sp. CONT]|nr:hypothetical protein PENSPDRAFT_694506 [Peniophora sp. CONT]